MSLKRLQREYLTQSKDGLPPGIISLMPQSDGNEFDYYNWDAVIEGPEGTPYHGGSWKISLNIPTNYPFVGPKAYFITPILHPNVDPIDGKICISSLTSNWSAVYTLDNLVLSIISLLSDPNPKDPLNTDLAYLMEANLKHTNTLISKHTKMHAKLN